MANDLRIRAASLTSTVTFGGTDQQFANGLLAYCRARGISTTGTNQQVLDRVAEDIYDRIKREAQAQLRREKDAVSTSANHAEVESELPF